MALEPGLKQLMTQSIVAVEQTTSTGVSKWGVPTYSTASTGASTYSGRYVPKVGTRSLNTMQAVEYVGVAWLASTGLTIGAKVKVPGSTGWQPIVMVENYIDDQGDVHHQKLFLGR